MAIGDPFGSAIDLINNLDAGNPLYLYNNDNSSLAIVIVKLVGAENYKMWATAMKIALKGKNKMGFIDGTCVKAETSVVLSQQWESTNKPQHAAFVAKTNNNSNRFNRRVNTNNNNNTNGGPNPNLLCKNYGLIGHTMERCYALIGYPAGFKRNPNLSRLYGNYNKRFNANCEVNQSVPSTSGSLSSSFTNEQMVNSSVRYGLENYVCYANLSSVSHCFSTTLNKSTKPKTFHEASQNPK
ncbi:ribonuclease H-like domain-containing protein [Tanacetum coccineum]